MMRILSFLATLLAILMAIPALAQEAPSGRYTMTPTKEGMLRLDTQTGEVSRCSNAAGNWACRSMPDDRIALENEIDRLNAENRRLRAERSKPGAERGETPGGAMPGGATPEEKSSRWRLPTDREIAELRTFFEKMMREFKDLVEPPLKDKPEKQL